MLLYMQQLDRVTAQGTIQLLHTEDCGQQFDVSICTGLR